MWARLRVLVTGLAVFLTACGGQGSPATSAAGSPSVSATTPSPTLEGEPLEEGRHDPGTYHSVGLRPAIVLDLGPGWETQDAVPEVFEAAYWQYRGGIRTSEITSPVMAVGSQAGRRCSPLGA